MFCNDTYICVMFKEVPFNNVAMSLMHSLAVKTVIVAVVSNLTVVTKEGQLKLNNVFLSSLEE